MKILSFVQIVLLLNFTACAQKVDSTKMNKLTLAVDDGEYETAAFAGGCFWCMEAPFESIDGVMSVISGFTGGNDKYPSYKEVSGGNTGHYEAVQIKFSPNIVSYSELLDIYWKQFDPTDAGGSFYDRGEQYHSAIFYNNDLQKKIAEVSKNKINKSGIFSKPIATEIIKYSGFYPAEDYHQDYYKTNPEHYKKYKKGSGRENFILGIWGDLGIEKYKKAQDEELKAMLTDLQYKVTQMNGTEKAFDNEYWDNNHEGIYVDIVSGEPLFSSTDKFKSGTGWPSFTKPIDPRYISKIFNNSYYTSRIEARSKFGNSHLGHIFNDGPAPTNLRYCINSASLKFIPKEKMTEMGYGEFLWYLN